MKICINPKTHHQRLQGSLDQPKQRTVVREIPQNYLIFALAFFKTTKPALKVEEQLCTERLVCWMIIWETISNIGFEVLIHSNHIVQAMFYVGQWNLDITSKTEYATSQKHLFLVEVLPFLHIRLCSHFKAHSAPDMTRWESKGVQNPQQLCQRCILCTLKKLSMYCFMAL